MITCIIGTRAQLIKMAPVLLELERRRWPVSLLMTGQHKETMAQLHQEFGISTLPKFLYDGDEITGVVGMALWFARAAKRALSERSAFLPDTGGSKHAVLVHGDTASTLLGAIVGRALRATVVHVEAGLRSRHLLHPFPEEVIRLWVTRLADVGFCPGEWACRNLAHTAVRRINTEENTLLDSVRLAVGTQKDRIGDEEFALASIHRFENIFSKNRLLRILEILDIASARCSIVFVLHPATRNRLKSYGLLDRLEANTRIRLIPRMGYFEFIRMAKDAHFVITDGGSNQEELSYLGVPTLLMRKATERMDGMGSTAVLCPYDRGAFLHFLENLPIRQPKREYGSISPSKLIADNLEQYV